MILLLLLLLTTLVMMLLLLLKHVGRGLSRIGHGEAEATVAHQNREAPGSYEKREERRAVAVAC